MVIKLNVLILARCKKINGTHTLVREYGEGLSDFGHNVYFVKLDSNRDFLNSLDDRVTILSIKDVICNAKKLDVIYCLTAEMYVLGLSIKKFLNKKTKVFAGVFHPRQYINPGYFENFIWNSIIVGNEPFVFMNDGVRVSHANFFEHSNGFPNSVVLPIPLNLPSEPDISKRLNAYESKPLRIVSIGRAVDFKKYPLGVMDALRKIVFDRKIVFEVYGDGPLLNLFKKIASENSEVNVDFMGEVQPEKIQDVLANSYVFVGMGYSLLTAAAMGVPAIQAIESTDGEFCYGLFSECNGYEVGEWIEGKELLETKKIVEFLLRLNRDEYMHQSKRSRIRSMSFSRDVVIESLLCHFLKHDEIKSINCKQIAAYVVMRIVKGFRNKLIGPSLAHHK